MNQIFCKVFFTSCGYFVQHNRLGSLGRRSYQEHLCEIFHINISGAYLDRRNGTIWTILVEDLFCEITLHLDQSSGGDAV